MHEHTPSAVPLCGEVRMYKRPPDFRTKDTLDPTGPVWIHWSFENTVKPA
jgi:hypothetical protein